MKFKAFAGQSEFLFDSAETPIMMMIDPEEREIFNQLAPDVRTVLFFNKEKMTPEEAQKLVDRHKPPMEEKKK